MYKPITVRYKFHNWYVYPLSSGELSRMFGVSRQAAYKFKYDGFTSKANCKIYNELKRLHILDIVAYEVPQK